MREIKFRYVFKRKSDGHIYTIEFKIEALEENNFNPIRSMLFNNLWELIARNQYTGLTDKNGVEIYEDDIVFNLDNKETFKISYSKIVPWFVLVDANGYEYLPSVEDYSCLLKIGNKHESPELMETTA